MRTTSSGLGSSPLARGLLSTAWDAALTAGIIPARAGFTVEHRRQGAGRQDHPRSRGVYARTAEATRASLGSSPLARGLRAGDNAIPPRPRIIPARAGFTTPHPSGTRRRPDHPRSRGVYPGRPTAEDAVRGSSPLARGLRIGRVGPGLGRRIIPARAGFTGGALAVGRKVGDHPRSRGVYANDKSSWQRRPGSSPLARGLPSEYQSRADVCGIIPARAGFTEPRASGEPTRADHPRSRGVYTCGSLVSQRTRSLPDPRRLHCRPRARSAGSP